MRKHSTPNSYLKEKQETTRERAERHHQARRAELTPSAGDEQRWARNRERVIRERELAQKKLVGKNKPYQNYMKQHEIRFEAMKDAEFTEHTSEYHAQGTISMTHGNNCFIQAFTSDEWVCINNFRKDEDCGYYMADVFVEQYRRIATRDGFLGKLPSKIKRVNICNSETQKNLFDSQGMQDSERLASFLTKTQNGKSTARICKAFGLFPKALSVGNDEDGFNVIVLVEPEGDKAQ